MTLLRELPAGMMYICDQGRTLLDHHGNLYAAPVPPTPHVAQEPPKPKPTPKPITLSESARSELAPMLQELAGQSAEHTLWAVLDRTGNLLEAFSTTSGHDDRNEADPRAAIERIVKTPQRKAVFLAHNHPIASWGGGEVTPSATDYAFTECVRERLAPFDVELIDHHICGAKGQESRSIKEAKAEGTTITEAWHATIDAAIERLEARKEQIITESQEPPTLREVEERRESQLWRAYGGYNPYTRR